MSHLNLRTAAGHTQPGGQADRLRRPLTSTLGPAVNTTAAYHSAIVALRVQRFVSSRAGGFAYLAHRFTRPSRFSHMSEALPLPPRPASFLGDIATSPALPHSSPAQPGAQADLPPAGRLALRWACTKSRHMQALSTATNAVRRHQAAAPVVQGCPSFGGPLTFGAGATATRRRRLRHRAVYCCSAPSQTLVVTWYFWHLATEPHLAGMPNPAIERTATGKPASAAHGERSASQIRP